MSVIVVHAAVFARIMTAAVIVVMGFIKIARSSLNASGNFFDLVVGQLAGAVHSVPCLLIVSHK